jgi:DNA-binding PadR family transcriptional regulator
MLPQKSELPQQPTIGLLDFMVLQLVQTQPKTVTQLAVDISKEFGIHIKPSILHSSLFSLENDDYIKTNCVIEKNSCSLLYYSTKKGVELLVFTENSLYFACAELSSDIMSVTTLPA